MDPTDATGERFAPTNSSGDTESSSASTKRSGHDNCDFHLCAIAASAGGLEPLREFFSAVPDDLGIVYVVIQHLSPKHDSKMPDLLSRVTQMPVETVRDEPQGQMVCPDHIYLIPPGNYLGIQNGRLILSRREEEDQLTLPMDHFLLTLARDRGRFSIAVILSGTGGDGSGGIDDIHQAGGLVMVQDPLTAKYDGMPERALGTGVCDVVARPEGLAVAITRYIRQSLPREQVEPLESSPQRDPSLMAILELLRAQTEIDFGTYKSTTIVRRIRRRQELRGAQSLSDYLRELESNPEEFEQLVADLLIGVTRFFRNPEAFEALQHEAITKIIASKADGDEIRVWVAGSATGEEAYSLAFLIEDAIRRCGKSLRLKMFASDAHRPAVDAAAAGIFTKEIVDDLKQDYRDRYFEAIPSGYQVIARLRQQIVFVRHNLLIDAPFTQMDLVTCRNLLIYLQPHAQEKVLSLFHFALRPGGFIFLGTSESLGELTDEFATVDQVWQIHRKLRDVQLATVRADINKRVVRASDVAGQSAGDQADVAQLSDRKLQAAYDALLSDLLPAGFLVAQSGQLLHTFGDGGRLLQIDSGRYSDRLTDIIHPDLRPSLGAAMQHCIRDERKVEYRGVRVPPGLIPNFDAGSHDFVLAVKPVRHERSGQFVMLVALWTDESHGDTDVTRVDVAGEDQGTVAALQCELSFTRENLQATIQELEASNEELQATNEEMTASNEELQSTNEELQSVNEELHTVNAEYHRKIAQLQESNDDMDNLLASSEVAVLFLDKQLQIRRFTPKLGLLLGLQKQDIGRGVDRFQSAFLPPALVGNLRDVLESREPLVEEIAVPGRQTFLVHVTPFDSTTLADGVVLSYSDVTKIRIRQDAELRWASIVESTSDCIIAMDLAANVTQWNRAAETLYGYDSAEAKNQNFFDLVVPREHREVMAANLEQVRSDRQSKQFDSQRISKSGKLIDVSVRLSPVIGIRGSVGISSIERNVTTELRARRLRELEECVRIDIGDDDTVELKLHRFAELFRSTIAPVGFAVWRFDPMSGQHVATVDEFAQSALDLLNKHDLDLHGFRETCFLTGQTTIRSIEDISDDGVPQSYILTLKPLAGKKAVYGVLGVLLRSDEPQVTKEIRVALRRVVSSLSMRMEDESHVESLLRVSEIVENAVDFIGTVDANGSLVSLNRAGRLLSGIGLDEAINHLRINDFHPDHVTQELLTVALPETRRIGHWSGESVIIDRQGTNIPVSQLIICHRGPAGDVRYFSTICRVIAEQKNVQRRLEEMIDETRITNDVRTRFVANISHDVRTPMTSVIGMTEILLGEDVSPRQREMLEAIRDNGSHVTTLLNDLLDLSRVDAGEMLIRVKPTDLRDLFKEIFAATQPIFAGEQVKFESSLQIPEGTYVAIDRTRVRQVVDNLISNARKFTVEGTVSITAAHRNDVLIASVSDTGCGIENSLLTTVFDPYKQVEESSGPRVRGAGLGLAISRKLAQAMGGELEVSSVQGEGSTFTLTMPARVIDDPSDDRSATASVSSHDLEKLRGRRILVAEDTRGIQYLVRTILEKCGVNVTVVADGRRVIELLTHDSQHSRFDALLLDMQMPIMDGYETASRLRQAEIDLPIIAMTASTMPKEKEAALTSGCSDFVAKPINQADLLMLLCQAINGSKD